jgi:hypothetical protein
MEQGRYRADVHISPVASIGERRLIHWFKEVGPNVRMLGGELKDTAVEAIRDRDPIKLVMAPVAMAARILLQGPDYLYAGVVDRKIEKVQGSETAHDVGRVLKDIVTLHPLRAAVGVLKLPGDVGMDIINAVGGFRGRARASLAKTPDHGMAA